MYDIVMRPMRREDVKRVHELEKICFITPWSYDSLMAEMKNKLAHYEVAELGGEVIGYAGMRVYFGEAHITNVAIAPEYRRKGYARRLMKHMMRVAIANDADCMTLEVREHNEPAKALYAELGFVKAGERKRYYTDTGESAYIMWNNAIARVCKDDGETV